MRILKIILIIVVALIALIGIMAAMAPSTYSYERSITIDAPPAKAYPFVSSLAAMDKWSPWNAYDPNMKKTMEGTDGTIGAKAMWEGNEDVGKGQQTITGLHPDQGIDLDLKFIEPFESESKVKVDLVPEGEGTKATWSMSGNNDMMGRVFSIFMDMDAMVGKDFEKGLEMLKVEVETAYAAEKAALAERTFDGYTIDEKSWPETVYVGKRSKKVKWSDMGNFFGTNFQSVGAACGAAKVEMAGAPSGIFWEWNEKDQTADMMAGFPVKAAANVKVPNAETHVIPACKMLTIAYYGDYEKSAKAHEAMSGYIAAKGLTHYGNVVEEYITDPMSEPDTAKWLTNIYYMVK